MARITLRRALPSGKPSVRADNPAAGTQTGQKVPMFWIAIIALFIFAWIVVNAAKQSISAERAQSDDESELWNEYAKNHLKEKRSWKASRK